MTQHITLAVATVRKLISEGMTFKAAVREVSIEFECEPTDLYEALAH